MRPDSEGICFAKQSEQWTSSPRSVMSGGVFNRKTPEVGKGAVKNQNDFLSNIGLNLGHALASFAT